MSLELDSLRSLSPIIDINKITENNFNLSIKAEAIHFRSAAILECIIRELKTAWNHSVSPLLLNLTVINNTHSRTIASIKTTWNPANTRQEIQAEFKYRMVPNDPTVWSRYSPIGEILDYSPVNGI